MSYGNGTNTPNGLVPRKFITGAAFNGQTGKYTIVSGYNTNIFTGDPVIQLNTGGIGVAGGSGAAGIATLGVFMGCKYLLNNVPTFSPYWPANTQPDNNLNAEAFVVDDPTVLFDIQVASNANPAAANPTIALTNLNDNANYAVGNPNGGTANPAGGNIRTGVSAFYLAFESITTTSTYSLKIVELTPVPGNTYGVNYNNALVLINNHVYKGGTGTAGV